MIEIYPFKISSNKVAAAKDFFPVRKTLVVPIFPEPISLISLSKNNGDIIKGKVGKDLNLEEGKQAALVCGINIISQVKAACNNDLEKVKNCIKLTGYVNSTDNFTEQPQVLNSASELMVNVFGDLGKHTRAAISVNSLPLNASVEIDAIFEII